MAISRSHDNPEQQVPLQFSDVLPDVAAEVSAMTDLRQEYDAIEPLQVVHYIGRGQGGGGRSDGAAQSSPVGLVQVSFVLNLVDLTWYRAPIECN